MGFSCKEISRDLKQSFPIWTCQRLILPKTVSFQLKISVPVCKTTRSRVSTCKGLWTNKRPQKEEEKTGNTCIWNMAKVKNEIKVYISPAKSIPAGPILPLICLFYDNTYIKRRMLTTKRTNATSLWHFLPINKLVLIFHFRRTPRLIPLV